METTEKNYKDCFLKVITKFKEEFTSSERDKIARINYIETFKAIKDHKDFKDFMLDLFFGMSNEKIIHIFIEEIPASELGIGFTAMEWVYNMPGIDFEFLGLSNPVKEVELRVIALFGIYIVREGYISFTGDLSLKRKNAELLKLMLK